MKYLKILPLFILLLASNSCQDYLDVNEDPSFPQIANGSSLLAPILAQMVRGEAFDARYVGQYVQYWGQSTSANEWDRHGYVLSIADVASEKWRSHYWTIGKNIDLIIEEGLQNNRYDYIGVAKAIRAWSWQTTTDYHGELILKQAWEPERYEFDFESQEAVYEEVRRLCQEALADIGRTDYTKTLQRGGDLVYRGNTDQWVKFINAVLARNAHHISNKASYNPDQVIQYVDKSFSSNADNFNVPHNATRTTDANFYGPLRNNMGAYRVSSYTIALLDGTILNKVVDPRLPLMFTASPDGTFRGVAQAAGDPNNVTGNARRIPNLWGALGVVPMQGKWIFDNATPHSIITYPELQFIKAEAAFRKGDQGMAYDAFKKGVIAAMDFVRVATADRDKYMTSEAVPQKAEDLKLSDIMLQKYIALYGQGALETWVDMRRHNYSNQVYLNFTPPTSLFVDNNGKLAQRIRPRFNSEYVWNRASLARIGADKNDYHTVPLWFSIP